MNRFFNTVSQNLIFFISTSMVAGFLCGIFFSVEFLRSFIVPAAFFAVYPMMASLRIEEIFKGNDIKLQIFAQVINFCIVPFIALAIGLVFFKDNPYLFLGILLLGIMPTGGGTISWTGFSKGNVGAAIKMAIIGPVVGAILAPFYIKFLIGPALGIDLLMVIKQIVLVILLPMLFGILTRKFLLKNNREELLSIFPSFSTIGVTCLVFIVMALKSKVIVQDPVIFLYILLPVSLLYCTTFALSTFIGRFYFERKDIISLAYGTSMRNLSIALAIAVNLFDSSGSDAALVITVAYIVQVQSAVWYRRLSNNILSPSKSPLPVLQKIA